MPGLDKRELVEQMTQFHFTGKAIVTYNDQIYVRLPFPTEFQCSVHGPTLFNLLKGLTTEKVKLELVGNSLKLNSVGVTAELVTGEGTEINEILSVIEKEIKTLKDIELLPSDFLKGVSLCAFSTLSKEVHGSYTCIKVLGKHMMTTDRTRFSLYTMSGEIPDLMFKASIAMEMIKYDLKLYSTTKSWIHFFEGKDGLVFSLRKYSGEFPTKEIIDMTTNVKPKAKVPLPKEILSALGFLNIFTDGQEQKHTQVTIKDGFLSLRVDGVKGKITKKIKVDTTQDLTFGINPMLLAEIMKRDMNTLEIGGMGNTPLAFFRSKNFVHAMALFGER